MGTTGWLQSNTVYEITTRTIQGRFLLRPSEQANDLIAGIIGRAQVLYPAVRLYGVVVLSNHITWMLSSPEPRQIPAFIGYINGKLSSELGRLHNWPGKLWERPHRPIPIVDNESLMDRFRYLLSLGCKEDLVTSPRDWPGVTCVFALLGLRTLEGTWYCRDLETKNRGRKTKFPPELIAQRYEVHFDKLPCWADLSPEAYREQVRELVDDIEREHHDRRARAGKGVLGRRAIVQMDPHHRPDSVAKSPAPVCHAATRSAYQAFRQKYREFIDAFRAGAERLKQLLLVPETFPPGCFPPRLPFVAMPAAVMSPG